MFDPEIAARILAGLESGKSLRAVCRELSIDESTTRKWERENAEFGTHSAQARVVGGHAMADECIDIADAGGDVHQARLRIDTRLRLLGKWLPKLYGDKLETVHSGEVGIRKIERVIRKADE